MAIRDGVYKGEDSEDTLDHRIDVTYEQDMSDDISVNKASGEGVNMEIKTSIAEVPLGSFNTISCPCSSYAIELDDGNIRCEIDDFGILKPINAISISNHLINGKIPKVGDKWRCIKIKCEQDGFKWDTLHGVKVEEKL